MDNPIPVLCDACRVEGVLGEEPFEELGGLLDFEPVPRKQDRVDGWDAQTQRLFIAALAATGSVRRAAQAVGRAPYGADQLRKAEGGKGFAAAWEEAMAHARDMASQRRSAALGAVRHGTDRLAPPPPGWSHPASRRGRPPRHARPAPAAPEPPEAVQVRAVAEFVRYVLKTYCAKLKAERECRAAGRIAEADFYVRQISWLEVALDMGGSDGFAVLAGFRAGGYSLTDIAETPFSALLDDARRLHFARCGDPPRPGPVPRHLLADHGRFSTEPMEATRGGRPESHEAQRRAFEERHRQDAADHARWEAKARGDFAARDARDGGEA